MIAIHKGQRGWWKTMSFIIGITAAGYIQPSPTKTDTGVLPWRHLDDFAWQMTSGAWGTINHRERWFWQILGGSWLPRMTSSQKQLDWSPKRDIFCQVLMANRENANHPTSREIGGQVGWTGGLFTSSPWYGGLARGQTSCTRQMLYNLLRNLTELLGDQKTVTPVGVIAHLRTFHWPHLFWTERKQKLSRFSAP